MSDHDFKMALAEVEWYIPPDCKWCDGKGWTWVQNGPDDVDKDPCECWVERSTMGTELAKYPSKSSPGKEYTIFKAADGTEYCDCWQWKRNKTCSHLTDYQNNGVPQVVAAAPSTMKSDVGFANKKDVDHVVDNIINKFNL